MVLGAYRNGRFRYDDRAVFQGRNEAFNCRVDLRQIGMAVTRARGRPDGNKDDVRSVHRCGGIGDKVQSSPTTFVRNEFFQFWLMDRYLAAAEHCYLGLIDIDAGDAMPGVSEARRRNQSYIAYAEYRNPHFKVLLAVDLQG